MTDVWYMSGLLGIRIRIKWNRFHLLRCFLPTIPSLIYFENEWESNKTVIPPLSGTGSSEVQFSHGILQFNCRYLFMHSDFVLVCTRLFFRFKVCTWTCWFIWSGSTTWLSYHWFFNGSWPRCPRLHNFNLSSEIHF